MKRFDRWLSSLQEPWRFLAVAVFACGWLLPLATDSKWLQGVACLWLFLVWIWIFKSRIK